MIDIAMFGGKFYYPEYKKVKSIKSSIDEIKKGLLILKDIPKKDILNLFNEYSKILIRSKEVNQIEGIAFLSSWLKRNNFSKLVDKNFPTTQYLEKFIGEKKRIKAQPRGIVCHWIAGNVPTLGLFSLFQSIFVGNANLMRIPPNSHETMIALLKVFGETKIDSGVSGKDILKSIAILYYQRTNYTANLEFSDIADARVVWGGKKAIEDITGLPKRPHCEDIIFGPKYSFAVFDSKAIKSDKFKRNMRFLVSDIMLFDQAACTSPHTVFFEKGDGIKPLKEIAEDMANEFKKASERFPKMAIDQYITSKIINSRAEYALDLGKDLICSKNNNWTILINKEIKLEEPVESRTIFIKEVGSILEVIPLITNKIQTIGCAVDDKGKLLEFADKVTFKGVSRCVNLGQMHLYDSPWDGMLYMSRLVNWVTLYYGK